jgi:hypothetical protein
MDTEAGHSSQLVIDQDAEPSVRAGARAETWLKIAAVGAFAVAMANVEAAAVVYLREAYGIDDILRDMPQRADRLTAIEIGREAATMMMLLTLGVAVGRRLQDRIGYFVLAFGAWDIAYYGWLAMFEGWPRSPLDWDILFLIPLPWWGPVIAPASIAAMMCVGGAAAVVGVDRGVGWRMSWTNAGIAFAGIVVVLYTFMADAIWAVPDGGEAVQRVRPSDFEWGLFVVGFTVMSWAGLRVTWPAQSRWLRT